MVTLAQDAGGGLVSCGNPGQPECQTCHVVDLVQDVSGWLVGLLSFLAAIMFMLAGYRILTAGGNPSVMKDAKSMIVNVAIGFAIVIAAWLLIDTFMKALLTDGASQLGPWNGIPCVDQPIYGGLPEAVITEIATSEICTSIDDCAARAAQCQSRTNASSTIITSGGAMRVECNFSSADAAAHPPDLSAAGACDSALVARYFPEQVGNAQCVIQGESTCGASMVSRTDRMRVDDRAFSFGPTQVNITVHPVVGCGPTLNCPDAFSGRNYGARVVDESLYQQCATALQNPECGLINSRRIYDDAQRRHGNGWQPWSAAGRSGCQLHNFY